MNRNIYIKDWLELKPYDKQTVTDSFYLKVCNDVKKAIVTNIHSFVLQQFMDRYETNMLSCFLTSYLEDVISETNIWKSFMKAHLRLYQKQLPFYILDDYDEEEINTQDVAFLIWYYLNTIQEEKMISPLSDYIIETAEEVMVVFDNVWEYAPENDYLKSFYQIDENESDFYVARRLIDDLLFSTYLFYPDSSLKLQEIELEMFEENKNDDDVLVYIQENRDRTVHHTHTQLLSFKGKEWVAEMLSEGHALKKDFLAISKKITGFFFYKGQDESNVFIEHIASGKKFDLTKKSFDDWKGLKVVNTIFFIGIVRWKDEWWFSGAHYQLPFDADLVSEEKNSIESRAEVSFLDHEKKETSKMIENQLSVFKQFNNGSQIAFLPSDQIDKFVREYANFYNKSLNLSKKQIRKSREKVREDGFFGSEDTHKDFSEVSETGLVFFNPKSGCEVALAVNSAFPLPSNPYYNEEDSEEHIIRLLTNESLSTELALFCIDNCKDKLHFFKDDIGKRYLKDIDFLLRFWKKKGYHTMPTVTYTRG